LKKSSKKFSKPLDKPHRVWYNNSVLKKGTQRQEKENSINQKGNSYEE